MKYFTLIGLFMLSVQFGAKAQMACNNFVNISLDPSGEATLFADMFLEGTSCSDCTITVTDEAGNVLYGPELNPVLDCFDTFTELAYTVTDPGTGNTCFGTFQLEDVLNVCDFGGPALVIEGLCSASVYQLVLNNNQQLDPLTPCVRILPDLESGINEVTFDYTSTDWGLNGVSTLDLVLMQQGIFNETMTPTEAILTDLDNDGAVSTIDLVSFRLYVLGILDATGLASYRIIDMDEDFSNFNPYDFDNDYQILQFEDDYFDTNANKEVAIYKVGDLNETALDPIASEIDAETRSIKLINFDNPYLESGQTYQVDFTVDINDLKGLTFGLDIPGAKINEIYSDDDSKIISNIQDDQILISFLSLDAIDQLTFTLDLESTQNGRFADMISLNNLLGNDAVDADLNIYAIDLSPNSGNLISETTIYPNPASEVAHIAFSNEYADMEKQVEIKDLTGKLIMKYTTYADQLNIDRSTVGSAGLYLVETKVNQQLTTTKVFFK